MTTRSIFFLLATALVLTACGSSGAQGNAAAPSPTPTSTSSTSTSTVTLTAIVIAGSVPGIGASAPFTATAHYSNGTTADVTTSAAWSTSDPSVAVVSPTGSVTLNSLGSCAITAAYQGVSGTFTIVAAT